MSGGEPSPSFGLKAIDYSAGSPPLQPMIEAMRWLGFLIMSTLRERRDLASENLALRQQLGVLKRSRGVPRLKKGARVFCMVLSRI